MRALRVLSLVAVVAMSLPAAAAEAPHENGTNCSNCHFGHNAPGGGLTKTAGNFSLCQSCHTTNAPDFGFAWATSDQAVPGSSGRSHRWDAAATNLGATAPSSTGDAAAQLMASHMDGANIQCSTCHDQHNASMYKGTLHTSYAVGSAVAATGTGLGRLTLNAPAAGAAAKAYRVKIVAGGAAGTATFQLSNDKGTSWFGCSAPTTYTYVTYASNPCRTGTSVALNDGTNVTVTFSSGTGNFAAGDQWDFYVSYPFLRADNTEAAMCISCHKDRNQSAANVEGTGPLVGNGQAIVLGTTVFSHPVGQSLANTYDRTVGTNGPILDADGSPQTTGDGIKSNNLTVGATGKVTCLTCHRPHNAYSNSLTPDLP